MQTNVEGIKFEAPEGFVREETVVSLRIPADKGFADARVKTPIRPNLIVHRRPERATDLAAVLASVQGELVTAIAGISPIESMDVTFADGKKGVLIAYTMPAPKGLEISQLQAMRLDDSVLTTLTVSTERAMLTSDRKAAYVKALLSARRAPPHDDVRR